MENKVASTQKETKRSDAEYRKEAHERRVKNILELLKIHGPAVEKWGEGYGNWSDGKEARNRCAECIASYLDDEAFEVDVRMDTLKQFLSR